MARIISELPGAFVDPACPLDGAHPLNRGIVDEWSILPNSGWSRGNTLRSIVRGLHKPNDGTLTNGPTWQGALGRPGGYGSLKFDGSDDWVALASTIVLADFSLFAWIKQTGDATIAGQSANLSAPQLRIGQGGANVLSTYDIVNNPQSSTLAVAQGTWQRVGFTRVGTTVTFWQNAISYGTGTFDPGTGLGRGSDVNIFGALNVSGTPALLFNGNMDCISIHNRALSASEVAALYRESRCGNPERWRWVSGASWFVAPAGGAAYSLTAEQGSYSLTGQSVGLRAARTLAAAQGSYALAGQSVNLLAARRLTAAQGSYALNGQAANLLHGRKLSIGQGSYTLTGQAAQLRAARLLSVATGSFLLTGQNVGLAYSGDQAAAGEPRRTIVQQRATSFETALRKTSFPVQLRRTSFEIAKR